MRKRAAVVIAFVLIGNACDASPPTSPSRPAIVTFQVADETFRAVAGDEATVDAARKAQAGGAARIPTGRIVAGTGVNQGWTWHLVDLTFAGAAIELCDGRPSYVEREGPRFGGGYYCPWSATIISVHTK
jgi:hypothetical protein